MTMEDENSILPPPKRMPWNKGKLIGAKPPLLARHVWSIRTKLQIERRARELAMFNLAIDSKLRGCDVVAMKVEDVAPSGYPLARATVRQRKTGRPVRFELTEQTRQAVDDYLKATGKVPGEFLFTSRRRVGEAMTTRQYARLVAEWITGIGLDPHIFATHSLRRTKATLRPRESGGRLAAGQSAAPSRAVARCGRLLYPQLARRSNRMWHNRGFPASAAVHPASRAIDSAADQPA
jgi:integrase